MLVLPYSSRASILLAIGKVKNIILKSLGVEPAGNLPVLWAQVKE